MGLLRFRSPRWIPRQIHRSLCHQWQEPDGIQTGIQVYSCITRSNVPLVLRNKHFATWYTCGPTVYDASHLGHASCYVKLDIIQRILRSHFKLNLVTAMNVTDIDDKIIKRSHETHKPWLDIARSYEAQFWNDLRKLGVAEPNIKIRVTENIPQIVAFIRELLASGLAYVSGDGSVYFDVSKYPSYGKLQKLNLEEVPHDSKESSVDFALWKARKDEKEPSWPSPWGHGRPGWHIECSVLASMIFGSGIDIHAGGLDLKFPHHENEEAQSCAYHGTQQWVNYWLHTGHLRAAHQQEKMSKSLKNTIGIDELLGSYSSEEFRMSCLLSNYRSSVEYGNEMMSTARHTLQRFVEFNSNVRAYLDGKKHGATVDSSQILQELSLAKQEIDEHLRNDFNTAKCVGILSDLTSTINKSINTQSDLLTASSLDVVSAVSNFVNDTFQGFGFNLLSAQLKQAELDFEPLLEDVVNTRNKMRKRAIATKNKDLLQVCDELRACLDRNGVQVKDHSQGTTWDYNKLK